MSDEEAATMRQSQFMLAESVSALLKTQSTAFSDHDLFVLPNSVQALWPEEKARLSYSEAQKKVEALSGEYAAAGYGEGHRVALLLENRPIHFLHWLALNALSVCVVPINPAAAADELRYLLSHSEAALLVRLTHFAEAADAVANDLGLSVCGPDDTPPPISPRLSPSTPTLETECALIYTSGTTGKPKGCILSNKYFLLWSEWYSAQGGHIALRQGAERLLTPLPTFHVNAMGHSFMGMLSCGGAQIIIDRFHPRSWIEDAIETGATCFHYLGVMPAILMELPEKPSDRSHNMRFGLGGGVHPEIHERFEERFGAPLLEGWAMTETGGAGTLCAAAAPRHVGQRCIGSPDRPGPKLEARLVDDSGNPAATGEIGELLIRASGENPREGFFSGYLKDPEATEAVWAGGWLHTGDVMRQDAAGMLYFVERKKNIIRRSGENITAAEVETVIAALPGIKAVAVIATPDPLREEEVLAVIVPKDREADKVKLSEKVFEICAGKLAYFKVPGYVICADELPTTSTQKVQKAALRPLAENPLHVPDCVDFCTRKQALRRAMT